MAVHALNAVALHVLINQTDEISEFSITRRQFSMDNTDIGKQSDYNLDLQKDTAEDTSSNHSTARKKTTSRRRKKRSRSLRADAGRFMIARLLALVCLVLVVFEGNIVMKLFSHKVGTSVEIMESNKDAQTEGLLQNSGSSDQAGVTKEETPSTGGNASVVSLAGGGTAEEVPETSAATASPIQNSEYIDSDKVVPAQSQAVDDSYFSNAVFIGDSRMEGFRNSSGITQGTFLTGVGLAINDMDKQIISTPDGDISVYQGLSGHQYDRIYLMLGANDLGYYPWDSFLPTFKSVLEQFHQLQPHAIIYVCSVIYVDESKIAAGYEYDNNDNVRTINGYILEACEELWYSYYLNLNEIFSDGTGSLFTDASPDGIHLYPDYLKMMLQYLKTHYITDEDFAAATAAHPDDIANAPDEKETEEEQASGSSDKDSDEDSDSVSVN